MNIEKLYTVLPPRQNLWVRVSAAARLCLCTFPGSTRPPKGATEYWPCYTSFLVRWDFGGGNVRSGVSRNAYNSALFNPFLAELTAAAAAHIGTCSWRYALLQILLLLFICRLWFSMFALFGLALGSILYTERERERESLLVCWFRRNWFHFACWQ